MYGAQQFIAQQSNGFWKHDSLSNQHWAEARMLIRATYMAASILHAIELDHG